MTVPRSFLNPYPNLDGEQAFVHYEHVRDVLPDAKFPSQCNAASGLLEIADQYDVFVFDAYGVLNVGGSVIIGSPAVVAELRGLGKQVIVLSNGASYTADASVKKFARFGYDFTRNEIISSRMAATRALAGMGDTFVWGAMAKANYSSEEFSQPTVKLADDGSNFDEVDGFLLLSTLDWNEERQVKLETSIAKNPRPVLVANPDIVSPRENHFGIEPGFFGHRLALEFGAKVEFHGKPFGSVFDIVDEQLDDNIPRDRICMIGDTLHTDILGGAAHGWHTVLVSDHGMFKGLNAHEYIERSGIVPNWVVPTI